MTQFERDVKHMRDAQRRFFAAAPGSSERMLALRESKELERTVDRYLDEAEHGPPPEQGALL